MDTVGLIIRFEEGDLSDKETVDFFAGLIKTGKAWRLQGHYGRTAKYMIEHGFISESGKVLSYTENVTKPLTTPC